MGKSFIQKLVNMKVFWLWSVIVYYAVLGQDVEYYPSQSIINGYHKLNVKREIKQDCMAEINRNNSETNKQNNWRQFNMKDNENGPHVAIHKRALDPVFHGYPKTREELWNERFINESSTFDQTPSLVKLLHNITMTYLKDCTPVILYDNQIKSKESYLVQNLFKGFPITFVHGYINDNGELVEPKLLLATSECLHFILFLTDIRTSAKVLGKQSANKVIIVARSSQWAVQEFLASSTSRMFVNLLVIGQSSKEGDDKSVVGRPVPSKTCDLNAMVLI